MKQIFISLCFLIGTLSHAQENTAVVSDLSSLRHYEALKTKIDLSEVYNDTDVVPEYPGGVNEFRRKIAEEMTATYKGFDNFTSRSDLYFIIEKDGQMSNIIALGDVKYSRFVQKTARSFLRDKWTPAMNDGHPVRFILTVPMTAMGLAR